MVQKIIKQLVVLLVIILVSSSFTSHAHKMKSAFTIVLFNDRTGNLEVMHRFVLHDAEEAAWQLFDAKSDIIADELTQAKFAAYVDTRFALQNQDGEAIPLEMIGFQNDAGYLWVYQEVKIPKDLTRLRIRHDALREIWTEQFNIVNVDGLDKTTSLHFSDSDTWRSVEINR